MNEFLSQSDMLNQAFIYLTQALTQEHYNLYIAIPLDAGYKVKFTDDNNNEIPSPGVFKVANIASVGFTIDKIEPGDNPAAFPKRVFAFSIKDFKPPAGSTLLQVNNLQYWEFTDADTFDISINPLGNIALGCPYLHVKGMIAGVSNRVQPKVIVPLSGLTLSQNLVYLQAAGQQDIVAKVELDKSTPSLLTNWESVDNISEYLVAASQDGGGFEIQIHSTTGPGVRKTKVRNKNKTSRGSGGGWRGFLKIFTDIFDKIFGGP